MMVNPDELTAMLCDLVRINSVNPSLAPDAAGEAEIAAYVARVLRDIGLEVTLHEHVAGRISVVGRLPGLGGGRSLMLNAHLDTVGLGDMPHPLEPEVREGRMYGRGTYDMKGSLAACLAAAKALAADPGELAGDLLVACVADEEYASIGTMDLLDRYRVDGAIITEATDLDLCLAHKGFVWIEVETAGRAAHGSAFADGIDANMRMGRVLHELEGLEQALRAQPGHPLVGPPSLHAGLLSGGTEPSTYAERCRLLIERRIVPGETEADAADEIRAIVDRLAAADPAFRATVRTTLVRMPFEVSAQAPIVQSTRRAVQQVRGRPPAHIGQAYWMDSALLSAAGVETAIIGPAGAGAHAREEWVDLDSVCILAEILVAAARDYCA